MLIKHLGRSLMKIKKKTKKVVGENFPTNGKRDGKPQNKSRPARYHFPGTINVLRAQFLLKKKCYRHLRLLSDIFCGHEKCPPSLILMCEK